MGTPHLHRSRRSPGFPPGQGLDDSRRPRELGWCSPAELCCSVAQGGKDREVWQHLQEGRAFLTTAVPDPPLCTGRKPALSCPRRKNRKRVVILSTALGLQCSGCSSPVIGTASKFPVGPHKLLQGAVLGQDLILSRHIHEPARSRTQLLVPRQTSWVLLPPKQVPETQVKSVHPAIPLGYGASRKWWWGAEKGSFHLPPWEGHSIAPVPRKPTRAQQLGVPGSNLLPLAPKPKHALLTKIFDMGK